MAAKWLVECHYLYGWADAEWERFSTRQEAQSEIDELIEGTRYAAEMGYMSEKYSRRDYRVVRESKCQKTKSCRTPPD